MPRPLVSLLVTGAVLVGPTHGYARGVHFGVAGPSGFVHGAFARAGFLDRHINFRSLAASGVVFVPCDEPYADDPVFVPYVALP